ncbi:uncharacterized protein [Diabrotica undecimpunctata]|uniref:uncharacterized protein isoform X1 n=1 Tax=Diabrotica undecimpunctata TaxID=50387 RepID=UPI003B637D28
MDHNSNESNNYIISNIFDAVEQGDEYKVRNFIENGADLDEVRNGISLIHYAVISDRPDIAAMLIECGVNLNVTDNNGNNPFHLAVLKNRINVAKVLIQNAAWDVNATNNNNESVLQSIQRNSRRFSNWSNFEQLLHEASVPTYPCASTFIQGNTTTLAEDSDDDLELNLSTASTSYASSGLKTSLHGTVYQLLLLMLFVYRALKNNYVYFDIATELDIAEKFDDVVIKYRKTIQDILCRWRFLQAKHKQDIEKHKITVNKLTKDDKGEYNVPKYFLSFCKIKSNPEYHDSELEELDLCTNTSFDFRESNKRKLDGTLTVVAQKINENIAKWKNYFIEDDIEQDEILYLDESIDALKYKFCPSVKDDLLKFMKMNLLENVLTSKYCKNFASIEEYLLTVKILENKSVIIDTIDSVNLELASAKTKTLLEQLSRRIFALKDVISDDKVFAGKSTTKLAFDQLVSNLKTTIQKIETTLKEEETKMEEYLKITSILGSRLHQERDLLIKDEENLTNFLKKVPQCLTIADICTEINKAGITNKFSTKTLDILKSANADLEETKMLVQEKCQNMITNTVAISLLLDEKKFDSNIKEFIDKFRIITNYPNVDELNTFLSKELGVTFQLLNADLVTHSFQKEILDFFKQYLKGRSDFLGKDKVNEFFISLTKKIRTLMTSGLNKAYPEKLKAFDITFQHDLICVNEFLKSNKHFLFLLTDSSRLGSIHLLQTLENSNNFGAHDSCVFLRLRTLLLKDIRQLVIDSFSSEKSHNLLIIEYQNKLFVENSVWRKLFNKFKTIIERHANNSKKVIFILNKNDDVISNFDCDDNVRIEELQTDFQHLTKQSQSNLLKRECSFQNLRVCFNKLINHETAGSIFDNECLTKLVEGKIIEIGNDDAFYFNDYIQEYYIERNLYMQRIHKSIFKEADKELFLITGVNEKTLNEFGVSKTFIHQYNINESYTTGIIWYKEGDEDDGEELKQTAFYKLNNGFTGTALHWLEYKDNYVFWKKSKGNLDNIFNNIDQDYICTDYYFHENLFSVLTNVKSKIIIISNNSGVGKSTFLTGLSRKMLTQSNSLWVIRINLNDFAFNKDKLNDKDVRHKMKSLREITFTENDIACAIDYFTEMATSTDSVKNSFQKRLLKFSLEVRPKRFMVPNIVVLFDGFDEISPTYTKQTITLIKGLVQTNVTQIYVTSRFHEKEMLENALQTPALLLKPLDEEEQTSFLCKFWKYSLKFFKEDNVQELHKKISEYVTELQTILDANEINDIMKNISTASSTLNHNLRSYVDDINFDKFARNLLNGWKNKIIDGDTSFSIVPLHLRMLAEIVFYDKFQITDDFKLLNLYNRFVEIKYDIFYHEKKNLGNTVGSEDIRERDSSWLRKKFRIISCQVLFPDLYKDDFVDNIRVQLARIGLLILKGNRLDFIHRSFAGFFFSEHSVIYFSAQVTQAVLFQTVLYEEAYNFVREFFNSQLKVNDLRDKDLIDDVAREIRVIHGSDTILHVVAHEGYLNIAQLIIGKLLKHPIMLEKILLTTGKYDGVFDEILHNVTRPRSRANPEMLKILLKELSGHYDILEKVITRLSETHGLILVGIQTQFTLLEKFLAFRRVDLFQTVLELVKNNLTTLRKLLLTNKNGLLNIIFKCCSKTTEPYPKLMNLLYETIDNAPLFNELLLEFDEYKRTVLHISVNRTSSPLFVHLLKWLKKIELKFPGVTQNLLLAKDKQGLTPIEIAVYKENLGVTLLLEFVREFFDQLFQELISLDYKKNILYKAITQGKSRSTELLLEWFYKNVDSIHLKNMFLKTAQFGRTCLHLASARNFHSAVKVVLEFLQKLNNTPPFANILIDMLLSTEEDGKTPLTEALRWKSDITADVFFIFFDENIQVNVINDVISKLDRYGRTCLHITVESGSSESLTLLLTFILKKFGIEFLQDLIISGDNYGNAAIHTPNQVLLDFIYENTNISYHKTMFFKGNNYGTTLFDIIMYPEADAQIVSKAKPQIDCIIKELINPTGVNITFTNTELEKIKKYINMFYETSNKDNAISIIDTKLQGTSPEPDIEESRADENAMNPIKFFLNPGKDT